MSNRVFAIALGLVSLASAPHAQAQFQGHWTTVASACVPDEESTGKFAMEQGTFQFLGVNTGSIDARCNVTNPADTGNLTSNPDWDLVEVTYNDPDGAANGSQVVVYLRRVHRVTGVSTDVHVFNSNVYGAGQQLRVENFNHTFDFVNYAYYIAISVRRNVYNLNPRIQRVKLTHAPVG